MPWPWSGTGLLSQLSERGGAASCGDCELTRVGDTPGSECSCARFGVGLRLGQQVVYKKFCAWRDAHVFQSMMDGLIAQAAARGETDLALVAVDSATMRAHQHASGMAASTALIDALVAASAEEKGVTPDQMSDIYRRQLRLAALPRRRLTKRVVRNAAAAAGAGPAPPSRSSGAPAVG